MGYGWILMAYQLKGGEEIRDGKLYGWTGRNCFVCRGTGIATDGDRSCSSCAGTGEQWGLMPTQPENLPVMGRNRDG